MTFHGMCRYLLANSINWNPQNSYDWLRENDWRYPIIDKLSPDFIEEEFAWIKDIGLLSRQTYLETERKGRGSSRRLGKRQREKVYDLLLFYQNYLKGEDAFDWADIPYIL